MSNLFQKIWNKNLLSGKTKLDKLSEDIGGLKGTFSVTKFLKGNKVSTHSFNNALTDLSKSTVVRLLAQGTSPWVNTIDPMDYKISRMRFGNAEWTTPTGYWNKNADLNLHYYKPSEISNRGNFTDYSAQYQFSPAGGRFLTTSNETNKGPILPESAANVSRLFQKSVFPDWNTGVYITFEFNSALFPSIVDLTTPPSHRSVNIKFYLPNITDSVCAIEWGNIYSRDPLGSSASSVLIGNIQYIDPDPTTHKIYYDYSSKSWKLQFKLGASPQVTNLSSFRVNFEIGRFNIVNSIVPQFGYNTGSGVGGQRYPLSSGTDFYPTVTPTYNNSEINSAIDDYSATFNVTMGTTQGNGSAGVSVAYTEAFLFNTKDDLFSIIRFPYPAIQGESKVGFEKNSDVAYLISWTIRALT
jgi:hypothetical protein